MLKGKMRIALTDVNTGKKEVIEESNMVTNALAEIFKPVGLVKDLSTLLNTLTPYHETLLGGLLLFDGEIEENVNTLYPPQGVNLTGCAVYNQQNNTTGLMRGDYNMTESEFSQTDKYMKFVYDFTTSQANGEIACVCLTHVNAGYIGYGSKDGVTSSNSLGVTLSGTSGPIQYANSSYTGGSTGDKYSGYTVGTTELLFLLDPENDIAYYLRIDSETKLTITTRRLWLKSVSMFINPSSTKPLLSMDILTLDTEMPGTGYVSYCFDTDDNRLYVISAKSSTTSADGEVVVTRINYKNLNVKQYEMANTSGETLNTSGTRFAFVHQGYLFMRGNSSPYEIYKFELGNAANVTQIKRNGLCGYAARFALALNGRLYLEYRTSSTCYLYVINLETDELLQCEAGYIGATYSSSSIRYPSYAPVLDNETLWYKSFGSWSTASFITLGNYLATINNLSEPVTKTADKTMKVTYIIEEE